MTPHTPALRSFWVRKGLSSSFVGLVTAGVLGCSGTERVAPEREQPSLSEGTDLGSRPTISITPANRIYEPGAVVKFQVRSSGGTGSSSPPSVAWNATGGTITSSGVYVGGQRVGNFRVIARQIGGSLADTTRITLSRGAPAGSTLILAPAKSSLAPGGVQQFTVSASWRGGTAPVSGITYRATGGMITSDGMYTAPRVAGDYLVVVSVAGSHPIADTASVIVRKDGSTGGGESQGGGSRGGTQPPVVLPSGLWLNEDFTSYRTRKDLLKGHGIYSLIEDVGINQISLDATDGCGTACGIAPGQPVQSMRYDIPDRTKDPRICHDYTVGRNINLPTPVQEVWAEVWAKFSSNFVTVVPGGRCKTGSAYKFLMFRVPASSRFQLVLGVYGNNVTFGYPTNETVYNGRPHAAAYFDGQWHRWRFHFKVGKAGIATSYLDNTKIADYRNVKIPRQDIYGIALSRNMNQGPTQPIWLNYGAVRAWATDPGWGW